MNSAQKDITLILPILNSNQYLNHSQSQETYQDFLKKELLQLTQEAEVFFGKFQLNYEIIIIEDFKSKKSSNNLSLVDAFKNNPQLTWITQNQFQGRAQSLLQGIQQSQGKYISMGSVPLMTSFSSYFGAIQALMSDSELSFVIGQKGTPLHNNPAPTILLKEQNLEQHNSFFKDVLQLNVENAVSSFFVFQNKDLGFFKHPQFKKLKGWYLTPYVLKKAQEAHLKVLEIPLKVTHHEGSLFRTQDLLWMYWQTFRF